MVTTMLFPELLPFIRLKVFITPVFRDSDSVFCIDSQSVCGTIDSILTSLSWIAVSMFLRKSAYLMILFCMKLTCPILTHSALSEFETSELKMHASTIDCWLGVESFEEANCVIATCSEVARSWEYFLRVKRSETKPSGEARN